MGEKCLLYMEGSQGGRSAPLQFHSPSSGLETFSGRFIKEGAAFAIRTECVDVALQGTTPTRVSQFKHFLDER